MQTELREKIENLIGAIEDHRVQVEMTVDEIREVWEETENATELSSKLYDAQSEGDTATMYLTNVSTILLEALNSGD